MLLYGLGSSNYAWFSVNRSLVGVWWSVLAALQQQRYVILVTSLGGKITLHLAVAAAAAAAATVSQMFLCMILLEIPGPIDTCMPVRSVTACFLSVGGIGAKPPFTQVDLC